MLALSNKKKEKKKEKQTNNGAHMRCSNSSAYPKFHHKSLIFVCGGEHGVAHFVHDAAE